VLSTANQVFAVELCIPQWIRCSLSNCVFCRESGVRCRICVVRSELSFCCRILSSAANQVSLPNLCCPQQICSLSNSVVRSESGVRCRIMLSAANQVFAAELCCPQWIRCSLPNLCCLQRVRSVEFMSFAASEVFAIEFVSTATNQVLLLKLCCLQRICARCRSCVGCNGSVIRCQNRVACSELAFATKSVLAAVK
jgi:hypothetical protein